MRKTGIDIGNESIKLVELENRKNELEIIRCVAGHIKSNDKKSALKKLLSGEKILPKHVSMSLAGPSVIIRYIEMPPMKMEELKSAIKFEAEKYIPFNISDSTIDCAMLDKTPSGSQRVLLVAARKSEVDNLLKLAKDCGIELAGIDADCFALLNSFQRIPSHDKENSTYALLNAGSRFSNVNIVTGGSVYFTRDILWGGADVTSRIKDAMGLSLKEAEALKKSPAEKREEIIGVIAPVLGKLTSQIRMSFDYFESNFGKNVEKIYISGGNSYLFNLVDFLRDNLGMDTMLWDPFEGIKSADIFPESQKTPAMFAVAIGLALRN